MHFAREYFNKKLLGFKRGYLFYNRPHNIIVFLFLMKYYYNTTVSRFFVTIRINKKVKSLSERRPKGPIISPPQSEKEGSHRLSERSLYLMINFYSWVSV